MMTTAEEIIKKPLTYLSEGEKKGVSTRMSQGNEKLNLPS